LVFYSSVITKWMLQTSYIATLFNHWTAHYVSIPFAIQCWNTKVYVVSIPWKGWTGRHSDNLHTFFLNKIFAQNQFRQQYLQNAFLLIDICKFPWHMLYQHYTNPECLVSHTNKFCMLAHNIFNIRFTGHPKIESFQ